MLFRSTGQVTLGELRLDASVIDVEGHQLRSRESNGCASIGTVRQLMLAIWSCLQAGITVSNIDINYNLELLFPPTVKIKTNVTTIQLSVAVLPCKIERHDEKPSGNNDLEQPGNQGEEKAGEHASGSLGSLEGSEK